MDWLDFLAVQGTLKSLLQHHSSKASILWCSAFFTVQLSHPYMMTGKTIALTRQNFVDKVMSLLFNMLSMLVITFLLRNKRLLISWLQSPSAMILEPSKIKSLTVSKSLLNVEDGSRSITIQVNARKTWLAVTAFGDGKGHKLRDEGSLHRLERQQNRFYYKVSRKAQPTPWFELTKTHFGLSNLRICKITHMESF